MQIISIDIETTGTSLDETNQILEVCAVLFDTKSTTAPNYETNPTFNVRINYDFLSGNPFALNMNKQLIEDLVTYQKHKKAYDAGTLTDQSLIDLCKLYVEPNEVAELFLAFLQDNGITKSVNFAGKNVGVFDISFLNNTVPFWTDLIKWKRRTIDPAILYVDNEHDEQLPDLKQCKERSGLFKNNEVSHHALEDAMDVALLVWDKLNESRESGVHMEVIDESSVGLEDISNFRGIMGIPIYGNGECEIHLNLEDMVPNDMGVDRFPIPTEYRNSKSDYIANGLTDEEAEKQIVKDGGYVNDIL